MPKIMILDTDYPSESNLYGDVFVHTRVKEYIKYAEVKVVSFFRNQPDYVYEGIAVTHAPTVADVKRIYEEFRPDAIFIHFYNRNLFSIIEKINIPVIIWVHGYEALGWYRRLFNYSTYYLLRNFHNIALPNIKQMIGFRKLVKFSNNNKRVHFVFVSNWMKKVAEQDSLTSINHYSIIPNPIDHELFRSKQKQSENRKDVLMIRSFNSKKYATDIAIEAILELSKTPIFPALRFSIYGRGKNFHKQTAPLKLFDNVSLHEIFLPNTEIPEIHARHGIFLCPTRQDAQGVSMCEAMSSGLSVISTDCTAIPEYIEHGKTGLLTNNSPAEIASAIMRLYEHPEEFTDLGRNASAFIKEKCDIHNIVNLELSLIAN